MRARESGRRRFSAEITSSPLPSPSRMSTTAKAGEAVSSCISPSATDSAVVTVKPRLSIARASRCRNDLSSSTISSVRSLGTAAANLSATVMAPPMRRRAYVSSFKDERRHQILISNCNFPIYLAVPDLTISDDLSGIKSSQLLRNIDLGAKQYVYSRGQGHFLLEIAAFPSHPHDCAPLRGGAVLVGDRCA